MVTMKRVNDILPAGFPLTTEQLADWSEDLNRLRPDVGRDQLMFLFDLYMVGELTWDRNKGIQNIFEGLRETEFVEGVWRKVKHWPG